jgi:hypothetical protein
MDISYTSIQCRSKLTLVMQEVDVVHNLSITLRHVKFEEFMKGLTLIGKEKS